MTSSVSAGATGMTTEEKAAIKLKARKIKAESLKSFFLTLGFPVVLADNATDNTSIVALPLKFLPQLKRLIYPAKKPLVILVYVTFLSKETIILFHQVSNTKMHQF